MTDEAQPRWRGINHLALVTPDMDATVRFYHGVLGMRLVTTLMAGPMRHYFFEVRGAEAFAKPAGIPDFKRAAQFDHLSFNLPDEEALHALQTRLKSHGCEVTDVIDHGVVRSIYFTDPAGIALEASWWVADATGRDADYGDERFFSDADPVAAVRELRETGILAWTPTTGLTSDEVSDVL